jgi:hypothetical protein
MTIVSDDDFSSTEELDGESDSECDPDVNPCMEDNVDALYSIDSDGGADMERENETVRMKWSRIKRRKMRKRMRMMAKNLGQLARERWYIHRLMM